jgi:hypothetical protein
VPRLALRQAAAAARRQTSPALLAALGSSLERRLEFGAWAFLPSAAKRPRRRCRAARRRAVGDRPTQAGALRSIRTINAMPTIPTVSCPPLRRCALDRYARMSPGAHVARVPEPHERPRRMSARAEIRPLLILRARPAAAAAHAHAPCHALAPPAPRSRSLYRTQASVPVRPTPLHLAQEPRPSPPRPLPLPTPPVKGPIATRGVPGSGGAHVAAPSRAGG